MHRTVALIVLVASLAGCTNLDPQRTEPTTMADPSPDCGPLISMSSNEGSTIFTINEVRRGPYRLAELTYNITRIGPNGTRDWDSGLQGTLESIANASEESRVRYVDVNGSTSTIDIGDRIDVGADGPYDVRLWNSTHEIGGAWLCV